MNKTNLFSKDEKEIKQYTIRDATFCLKVNTNFYPFCVSKCIIDLAVDPKDEVSNTLSKLLEQMFDIPKDAKLRMYSDNLTVDYGKDGTYVVAKGLHVKTKNIDLKTVGQEAIDYILTCYRVRNVLIQSTNPLSAPGSRLILQNICYRFSSEDEWTVPNKGMLENTNFEYVEEGNE